MPLVGSARKLTQIKIFPILVIAGAGFILTVPVVVYGIPFFSDDAVTQHAVWYVHFSEQLWDGDLYPRWLMGMNKGLGSPVFFFYPPLPFFITSLFRPLFTDDVRGWYQLGLSASLALMASGLCAYLWLKEITDRNTAIIAAVLYMATPYHLASDLYVRGAFAEYWAFVWMPLILFFAQRIVNGHRLAVAGLAVSYALLVMTHLPTTLIFSAIPICYAFFTADTDRRLKSTAIILVAMALGTGLSAIYLWPAMTTQHLVMLDRMSTGYFSVTNWLFFSNFSLWTEDKIPLLLLLIDLAGIGCCAFIFNRSNRDSFVRRQNLFWFVVVIIGVVMMTDLGRPIWTIVPVLKKIQFPWRINAVISLATTALLALSIYSMKKRNLARFKIARTIALLLIAAWIPATAWAIWHAYPFHNPDPERINSINREIAESREVPEYFPRSNKTMMEMDWEATVYEEYWDALLSDYIEALFQRVSESDGSLTKVKIVEGSGQVNVNSWKPGEISLHVETPTGLRLYVSQFYYPNWKAHLAGESSGLNVEPSEPDGLISLSIPGGDHQLILELERSKAEAIGGLISLMSLIITVSYIVAVKRQSSQAFLNS